MGMAMGSQGLPSCGIPKYVNRSSCPNGLGVTHAKRLPLWSPPPDRVLLVTCIGWKATNRLSCVKRSLILAALLNRTALIPEEDICPLYNTRVPMKQLLDLGHLKTCLNEGHLRIQTLPSNASVKVDMLRCEGKACPQGCILPPSVSFPDNKGKLFVQTRSTFLSKEDLLKVAEETSTAQVLSLGDLFYTFSAEYKETIGVPMAALETSSCQTILQPSRTLMKYMDAFVSTYTGADFAAVILRTTDFLPTCRGPRCHVAPMAAIVNCIIASMEEAGLRQLFVATDHSDVQVKYLDKALSARGITMLKLPDDGRMSAIDHTVLEVAICVQARQFFFHPLAAFAHYVVDMRAASGNSLCWDKDLSVAGPQEAKLA